MQRMTILIALTAAGCSANAPKHADVAAPLIAPAAAPPAKTAPHAVTIDEKTELLAFHLAWPAEISAVPELARRIQSEAMAHKAELLKAAAADQAYRAKQNFPFHQYEFIEDYRVVGDTPGLLGITAKWYEFTGGAHGMHGTKATLWDRSSHGETAFADLFSDGATIFDRLFRTDFCAALDKAREKKRGPVEREAINPPVDAFTQCPKFPELVIFASGNADGPMTRITFHADPYVAGPYAEGDYDIDLPVTYAIIDALKPEYRSSFAVQRQ